MNNNKIKTPDFEANIISFLLQCAEGKNYLTNGIIKEDMFNIKGCKHIFKFLNSYYNTYSEIPSFINFIEYINRIIDVNKLDENTKKELYGFIEELYIPLSKDVEIIKETIFEFAQKNLIYDFIERCVISLDNDEVDIDKIKKEMLFINNLKNVLSNTIISFDVFKDYKKAKFKEYVGYPCKFQPLNDAMLSGGFLPPQIVVFISGPKAGKTTMLVNITTDYAKKGKKILYIDTENGIDRIKRLCYQCLLKRTNKELVDNMAKRPDINYDDFYVKSEIQKLKDIALRDFKHHSITKDMAIDILYSNFYDNLNEQMDNEMSVFMQNGGEIKIISVPPIKTKVQDIELYLENLLINDKFKPDIIVCDYFDNMRPTEKLDSGNKRLMLQSVYMEWKELATQKNILVFTVSQINRAGFEKEVFTSADIAEDFGKVANADAIIGFQRTEADIKAGKGRLFMVANRDGYSFIPGGIIDSTGRDLGILLDVDSSTCTIEISKDTSLFSSDTPY